MFFYVLLLFIHLVFLLFFFIYTYIITFIVIDLCMVWSVLNMTTSLKYPKYCMTCKINLGFKKKKHYETKYSNKHLRSIKNK